MEKNKLLLKLFKQKLHITDIKCCIIGIRFFEKYIPIMNILNSELQIKGKYTKLNKTSLIFFKD